MEGIPIESDAFPACTWQKCEISEGSDAFLTPSGAYSWPRFGLGENFCPVRSQKHGVGDKEVAAPGFSEPRHEVKAHAFGHHQIGIMPQAGYARPACPTWWKADPHEITAMMAAVM